MEGKPDQAAGRTRRRTSGRGDAKGLGVPRRREIFDRRQALSTLAEIAAAKTLSQNEMRVLLLGFFKSLLAHGRGEIRRRFDEGADGSEIARALTFLVDQIIRVLVEFVETEVFPAAAPGARKTLSGGRLTLVAVGGYGRAELAPHSDLDILFLIPGGKASRAKRIVAYILYILWDLGLKVGHATRSVDECIKIALSDHVIRTTLLESRYLAGDRKLYGELQRRFRAVGGSESEFIEAKLAERNVRHKELGDSRYVLEPNIKKCKGGLRDLHTLFWIAKYIYRVNDAAELVERGVLTRSEADLFAKASTFLLTLRCHLHYLSGRPEDHLTFDLQPEISRRMGYTDHAGTSGVERLMKHYFLVAKDVGDLTRIFCAALEAERKRPPRLFWRRIILRKQLPRGFAAEGVRITAEPEVFRENPRNLIRLFHIAQRLGLDIHPDVLRQVRHNLSSIDKALREDVEANRLFMEILTSPKSPDVSLMRMNEAGVMGRFIPDFGRIVAQVQHDMYHVYTVDDHSIRAIGILSRIEKGELKKDHPLATEVVHELDSRRALYLAVLIHDIAKGRSGDHKEIGAGIALKLGPRLGLDAAEAETVSWLVRHHLLMSETAFSRDINDPKTMSDFVELVQSLERLRLLLVLTVADIRAVGPTVWNGWKAALLRSLYHRAKDMMSGGLSDERVATRVKEAKAALKTRLSDWSDEEFAEFVDLGYPVYWLSQDTDSHVDQAQVVRKAWKSGASLTIDSRVHRERDVTEVIIHTPDHPGLFSEIAGAIALAGGNIVDARIFTMTNGMALDTFSVQEVGDWVRESSGSAFDEPGKLEALEEHIEKVIAGALALGRELAAHPHALPRRSHVFTVAPEVHIDNNLSAFNTVIEVIGRDWPGLLSEVTRVLTNLRLQIATAKISTYGVRVVDVFYVKDLFGLKIDHEGKLQQVREALLQALSEPSDGFKSASLESAESQAKVAGRRRRVARAKARSAGKAR